MRILQVRFRNLNSLAGEWKIDLMHPAFASDGIFAITGPTGAGKTTILDAICLALYGRTPRLERVTRSGNEIISRQTGECFAEVAFETQTGRYRCHWSQHRARRKPDGELQAPKHEIANADSGEVIESNIKGVADQIEKTTGMDFDRFSRSMLLAQGGFDAFLRAAAGDRAPILEQITGTEIYSRISMRVHERQREEREKLNILQAESAGIPILEPEQEEAIGQALETGQKEEAELAAKSADAAKAIAWLTNIDSLKREITNLADEAGKLQNDIEAFKADRETLNRSLGAASLDGVYATLAAARKQQVDDGAALKTEEEALPGLESSVREQARALKSAELHAVRVKEELKTAAPILQKVRSLDQRLTDQKKAVLEGDEGCRKDAVKIEEVKKARLEEKEKRAKADETLELVEGYLEEHAADEWLISGLAGVEEQLGGLLSRQNEILQRETDHEKARNALELAARSLDDCHKQCGILKQELEQATIQRQQGNDILSRLLGERLLREYRTEKETLLREMAYISKIAELEEHRAKLEDGRPCPLCGATGHPFAEGNVPVPDETEQKIDDLTGLINKAEDQEAAIKKFEQAESMARNCLTNAEIAELAAAGDRRSAGKALAGMKESLEKLRADFAECRQAVLNKLLPLGVREFPDAGISSLPETLRTRLKAWQAQVKQKVDLEKQLADNDGDIKRLDAIIQTQRMTLAEKRERLELLKTGLATTSEERRAVYGAKNPDAEERRLQQAIYDAEVAEREAREKHSTLRQKTHTATAHVETLKRRIDQRQPDLEKMENEFSAALEPLGFTHEERFLAARLPSARRSELAARAGVLDERQTELKARQRDRETRLATEMLRNITDKSLQQLEPRFREYQESLKELRDSIAGLRHKLSENAAAKERLMERQTAVEAQKRECIRWENLHQLIGSADGKKYRNFAQGVTFEMMIGHANRQLQKMTDRYLLIHDDSEPLELNVVDNYQAGEIRSTKNLSGGESFIVSLSLALGLSHMASKNVRVDSLFLDEGFGTLDEEALDTALETLAGLQRDGKLIGVISHVPALKERISTQILVTPQTGGRSRISGPGCSGPGKELSS